MKIKASAIPTFKSESDEADWWASPEGREFVRRKAAAARKNRTGMAGSQLVEQINRKSSVQIALRLPEEDIEQARRIASRKGIGYQTLLKMLVREGLQREARRR